MHAGLGSHFVAEGCENICRKRTSNPAIPRKMPVTRRKALEGKSSVFIAWVLQMNMMRPTSDKRMPTTATLICNVTSQISEAVWKRVVKPRSIWRMRI